MSEPQYDVIVEKDVMIVARDGIKLATDIYRPARNGRAVEGRFPVILERTPYDKPAVSRSERTARDPRPCSRAEVAAYFVRHGYVVVYQDCRGRYGSEGEFVKYLERRAGRLRHLAWIVEQPWCNGPDRHDGPLLRGAHASRAGLSRSARPGRAVLDSGGFSNAYQAGIRQGGAFELKQATWAFNQALRGARGRQPIR